jgi:glycosyltransferase involved in cell wall biosynthesis
MDDGHDRRVAEVDPSAANQTSAAILLVLKRIDCNDGVASYLESITHGLSELGDRVVIVSGEVTTNYGSEFRRRSIRSNVDDWIVIEGMRDSKFPRLEQLRTILRIIRKYDIKVISPQGLSALPVARLLGWLTRLPVATNFHLITSETTKLSRAKTIAYRAVTFLFASDIYIAMSTDIEDFFTKDCRISPKRIHKQLLGVDTSFFRPPTVEERRSARDHFALSLNAYVSVLPARLNKSKGQDIATAALRVLRNRRADLNAVCLFAGDGDQRDAIFAEALQDDADSEMFRFLGYVDRETLRAAYWAADIVLLPSRVEGFGLGVAEAMCCGAIAIRTPGGGWQDQIREGETGLIIPFDDSEALAVALEKIADSPDREAMRSAAIALASTTFAKETMLTGTSAMYRRLASQR